MTGISTGEGFVRSGEPLQIVMNRGSGLFSINLGWQKRLFDPITELRSFGSGPPEYMHSAIADYLRVNADMCGDLSKVTK